MSVCPRVTGYNRMSRKLRVGQAELISECHLSIYLAEEMDMFSEKNPFIFWIKSFHFPHRPHAGICQVLAICCSDVCVRPLSLPFFSLAFVTLECRLFPGIAVIF